MRKEKEKIKKGFFHFRMNKEQCIRVAQMLYENGMPIGKIENEIGGKVTGVDGELEWENWGRMIRIDE